MVKFVALYKQPADVEAFENAYRNEHLPLINKVKGLDNVEITHFTGGPRGDAEYYMMAELYFKDQETMMTAMGSPEMAEAGKNLMSFAKGIVSMSFGKSIQLAQPVA